MHICFNSLKSAAIYKKSNNRADRQCVGGDEQCGTQEGAAVSRQQMELVTASEAH